MDALDRRIINELQGEFPVCERPFIVVAERLGMQRSHLYKKIEKYSLK